MGPTGKKKPSFGCGLAVVFGLRSCQPSPATAGDPKRRRRPEPSPPRRDDKPRPGPPAAGKCTPPAAIAGEAVPAPRRVKGGGQKRGNLGSIKGGNSIDIISLLEHLPKTAKEMRFETGSKRGEEKRAEPELCRALSRVSEPERMKEMGNVEYRKERFVEAVEFYDRAIAMDSKKASYYGNKAAALVGLGRLVEAAAVCREAVRMEPLYFRGHCRLGAVYFRLGDAEKAIYHLMLSKKEAKAADLSKAKSLEACLARCKEARKAKNYKALLEESQSAASIGADSSPQVFAYQAEALLKLGRQDEADCVLNAVPKFNTDEGTNVLGAVSNAYYRMVCAQVDMATGRFDSAVLNAQKASQINRSSLEILGVVRRAKAVAASRARGNELFKGSKFAEACTAYWDGLNHDPHNAVLLCNRAACRAKLGQYEGAIEDCDTALLVRPAYSKARLRRADCNAKLENWGKAIKDYRVLAWELPGDEEVRKALFEAIAQLKKQRNAHVDETD